MFWASWIRIRIHQYSKSLKGTVSREFLLLVFFHESVSLKPLSIPIGPFRMFSKIRGDIRSSRFATGVNNTRGTGGKIAVGVVDTGGKFAAGVVDTGGKFATGVVDTDGNLPPVVHLDLRISPRIFEKI